MPNEFLRDRIQRKLAGLPDERLYQVLDFVEFLETKYAEPTPASTTSFFQRFAEGVEDRLRAGRVSTQTIAETMNLMHRAVGVLSGVATAGRSVATEIVEGVNRAATVAATGTGTTPPAGAPPAGGPGTAPGAADPPPVAPGAPPAGSAAGPTAPGPTAPGSAAPGGATPPPAASGDRPA